MLKSHLNACVIGMGLILVLCSGAVAYEFGSKVAPGDADIGNLLYNCDPILGYWDIGINPMVYDEGDIVYLNMDSSTDLVDANDVRLTPFGAIGAGTKVAASDNDIGQTLRKLEDAAIVYMELDGSPGYNLEDSVYIHINPILTNPSTQPNDIRLNKVNGLDAGTRVKDFHGDNNMPVKGLVVFPWITGTIGTIRFYNANGNYNDVGNPIYDYPDVLYLDVSIPGNIPYGAVVVNDVRLSV